MVGGRRVSVWVVLMLVSVLLVMTACGAGDGGVSGGSADGRSETAGGEGATLTPVKFQASWLINYQSVGYIVAIEQGFYEEEGLNVEIVPGGPDINPIQSVLGGTALIGTMNVHSVVNARAEGLPIKVVGARYQIAPDAIVCRADRGVTSPADLVGKKVGVPAHNRSLVEAALRVAGIDPAQVELVPIGADLTPILKGTIDCQHSYLSNEPVALKQQRLPVKTFTLYEMGYRQQGHALFVHEKTLENQRDVIERFVRASAKGWRWAIDHPEEAIRVLVDKYSSGLDYDQQLQQLQADIPLMVTPYSSAHGLFALDPNVWEDTLELMHKYALVQAPVTTEELIVPDVTGSGT